MNKTSQKDFKTDKKLVAIAVLIILSQWIILNTEPELSLEDNLIFHQETKQSLKDANDKIDLLTNKVDSLINKGYETK